MLPVLKHSTQKVFVSQAMQHSTSERVHKERDAIIDKLRRAYPNCTFELIDQYHVAEPVEWKSKSPRELRWARLGRSIEMMSHADIIVFTETALDGNAPGCASEFTVATRYRNEYPLEYYIIMEKELNDYLKKSDEASAFYRNIINCVDADIKEYDDYFNEIIAVLNEYIPIDFKGAYVNDTDTEWYIERSFSPYYICAELSKCTVIDEADYDGGGFFKFVFESGYEEKDTSRIIIKSFNDGTSKGLKVDEYYLTDSISSKDKKIFEALKEACE